MTKRTIMEMAQEAGMVIHSFWAEQKLEAFAALVREDEREACADVVESTPWSDWFRTDCAAAIRARLEDQK